MPIKATVLLKKADHLTSEQFIDHWSNIYPKTFQDIAIVRQNIKSYRQFHLNAPLTAGLKERGVPVSGYDGMATIYADSVPELLAVFQSEDYHRIVVPEEEKFLKRAEVVMMFGEEEVKW